MYRTFIREIRVNLYVPRAGSNIGIENVSFDRLS